MTVPDYQKTKIACYLGIITQAITSNFAPLLFLKFHTDYHISLGSIAIIPATLFITQIFVDIFCAKYVDRIGYRKSIILSEILSALGLIGLTVLPELMSEPLAGIVLCVAVYAVGSGLIEVLVSPIMEACPFKNKEATMSLLHSFYCWGTVSTILISTVFLAIFGIDSWKILACLWAAVPLVNIYNFATCPIVSLVEDGKGMSIAKLCKTPMFFTAILLMVCAGASELAVAQWASAYAESALHLSKTVGDLAGPCMFAVAQGLSRAIYGKRGERIELKKYMVLSGILCVLCYVTIAASPDPIIGLAACIICGFSVGIMWPGTISLSSKTFPTGGTAMFALLAMAGDLGGAIGPGIVGRITQYAGDNIRIGMSAGIVFPVILVISLFIFKKRA